MTRIIVRLQLLLQDKSGQDLIEYAMMAGFIALAAGATMPSIATGISTVFSKVSSTVVTAGG
jgi:pilus assembly protein Flp/PilA